VHMKPKFEPGDLVSTAWQHARGIVVGVMPSNHVPDATVRGLGPDMFGWMYYVLSSDLRVNGPMASDELHGVT
jgi:hypothetical protein